MSAPIQKSAVATPLTRFCKHCGKEIEKPRKGKEYCSARCRFKHWESEHPRMVRWK